MQKVNASKLGTVTDLGAFLFGQERGSLDAYRPILLDVQKGICLYCLKPLSKQSQVDHFVPWSRYPADLGHNFVLAHDKCNNAKSDYLAAEQHLAAWAERNSVHRSALESQLQAAALPCDWSASIRIARWVYQQGTSPADHVLRERNRSGRWSRISRPEARSVVRVQPAVATAIDVLRVRFNSQRSGNQFNNCSVFGFSPKANNPGNASRR